MEESEKVDINREFEGGEGGGEEEVATHGLVSNAVSRGNLTLSSLRSALLQLRDHHFSLNYTSNIALHISLQLGNNWFSCELCMPM